MTRKHRENRARKIRLLSAQGITGRELAKRFGISKEYVSHILNNRKQYDPDYTYRPRPTLGDYIGEIKQLRKQGLTLAEIGERIGIKVRKKVYTADAVRRTLNNHHVLQRTNGSTSHATTQSV